MKRGLPEQGELVVCQITKIYPNSAFAELLEYGKTGMIHVSEVASRWVRDIREFLKENQYVVCRIIGVKGGDLSLSIKRVRRDEAGRKLSEFKREKKSEVLLEQIAKTLKKSRDQAFEEAGYLLQEEFGSLTKAFEVTVKNPALLEQKGIPPLWAKAIAEVAAKKFGEKTYRIQGSLELTSTGPDGMEAIRGILLSAKKKGFAVSYISAPRYGLALEGKDFKKLKATLEVEGNALVESIRKEGGQGKFEIKG